LKKKTRQEQGEQGKMYCLARSESQGKQFFRVGFGSNVMFTPIRGKKFGRQFLGPVCAGELIWFKKLLGGEGERRVCWSGGIWGEFSGRLGACSTAAASPAMGHWLGAI